MLVALFVFWFCFGALVHSYCIYPLLLLAFSRLFGRPLALSDSYEYPAVAVVVPAYNEADVISRKIENILAFDYPAEKLSVWVGSDCSTDGTDAIVSAITDPRVHVWVAPDRGGKTQVINRLLPTLTTEIVLLTDANTMHKSDSLRLLVRNFSDPAVGAVAGHIEHCGSYESSEFWYRSFEVMQKQAEARLHSSISAFGGFYAIRRSLFKTLPSNAYSNDDVLIPMNVIRQGYRVAFEHAAISAEDFRSDIREEFRRRIRIGAGNFQSFFWLLDFFNPLKGWPAFSYVSHKAIRWFSPVLMVCMVLCCGILALGGSSVYRVGAGVMLGGVAVALLYPVVKIRFLRPFYYFIVMNGALLAGLVRYSNGIKTAVWQPTPRK